MKCENPPGAVWSEVRPGRVSAEWHIMDTQLCDDDHNMTIFILYLRWCLCNMYNVYPPSLSYQIPFMLIFRAQHLLLRRSEERLLSDEMGCIINRVHSLSTPRHSDDKICREEARLVSVKSHLSTLDLFHFPTE